MSSVSLSILFDIAPGVFLEFINVVLSHNFIMYNTYHASDAVSALNGVDDCFGI
ncbi:26761_t:CDS:2 [Racocetra persica]|uniref:26761_t:CDS:1 n=1 Tax=Racocetra persica TaxID=160502 RepID=A0ACA9KTU3_9GLOM|nr:26761_t:CDS:2 [Racocetra persica]